MRERGVEGGDDFLGGMIYDLNARFAGAEATALAIDNAATFYVAGHETTANALAWSVYLMAGDPGVQDRARAEAVGALDGAPDSLPERLPYLRQVLDEALRLYPPAPRFDREAIADDELFHRTGCFGANCLGIPTHSRERIFEPRNVGRHVIGFAFKRAELFGKRHAHQRAEVVDAERQLRRGDPFSVEVGNAVVHATDYGRNGTAMKPLAGSPDTSSADS